MPFKFWKVCNSIKHCNNFETDMVVTLLDQSEQQPILKIDAKEFSGYGQGNLIFQNRLELETGELNLNTVFNDLSNKAVLYN